MNMSPSSWMLLSLTAAACAQQPDLNLQADPPIPLASYSTYRWASAAPAADSVLSERARVAVARSFSARGLADSAHGDIAVAVSLHAQSNPRWADHADDTGTRAPMLHMALPRAVALNIETRLAIDIYDARSQRPIWRGLAAGRVDPDSDADIGRMVSALLAHASR